MVAVRKVATKHIIIRYVVYSMKYRKGLTYLRNLKSSLSNSTTNLYIITTYNTIYSSTMTAIHTSTITIWKMPKKEKKKKRPHPDYIVGEIFNIWH